MCRGLSNVDEVGHVDKREKVGRKPGLLHWEEGLNCSHSIVLKEVCAKGSGNMISSLIRWEALVSILNLHYRIHRDPGLEMSASKMGTGR